MGSEQRMKKKIIAAVFAGQVLLASMMLTGTAEEIDISDGGGASVFADVLEDSWYAQSVKSSYENGLMQGVSDTLFSPMASVSYAQAVTLSVRLHAKQTGGELPAALPEQPWYMPYVTYAKSKGFLVNEPQDYEAPILRSELAVLLCPLLETTEGIKTNEVKSIGDVPAAAPYSEAVLKLYQAGILSGKDSYGSFYPASTLTRAEMATILNRFVFEDERVKNEQAVIANEDAYLLCENTSFVTTLTDWRLDYRGVPTKLKTPVRFAGLTDTSTVDTTAAIRRFNDVDTGRIVLNTSFAEKGDGAFLAFCNSEGEPVYLLERMDGAWCVRNAKNERTYAFAVGEDLDKYRVMIELDLDNSRSVTYINDEFCGEYALLTKPEQTVLSDFRYATTKEGTASLKPQALTVVSNYGVYESFAYTQDGAYPQGWELTKNVRVQDGMVCFENLGQLAKGFALQTGKVVAEYKMFFPKHTTSSSFILRCAETEALRFHADEKDFYVNQNKVYSDYYDNMWYRLRFELDFDQKNVLVKLNGRKISELALDTLCTGVDTLVCETQDGMRVDDFRVFRIIDHEDYVPAPIQPVGEEKYTVGINVCSLWTQGQHIGWAPISSFEDNLPVLGYYDEGVPETADWEIKYMVEHGIDFQAFCWYADSANGPLKEPTYSRHLHDGYMNAQYADRMKYCLLFEAANGCVPDSVQSWKEYYIPFFVENYLKDPRYMTVDNRPLFCVFGVDTLIKGIGGASALSEAFELLDQAAKELGYDGMLYLNASKSDKAYADIGFDGCFAYSWGTSGYSVKQNQSSIQQSKSDGYIQTIPTVSVGFNEVAWARRRYPLMSIADYQTTHEWVKSEYFDKAEQTGWNRNFVWISTWNEYGEGTYIMPVTGEKGFGYLDVLREMYTDEKADPMLNAIPTENQRKRINHLYPQDQHLLRKYVDYADDSVSLYTIDFSKESVTPMDIYPNSLVKDETGLTGTSAGNDPILLLNAVGEVDLSSIHALRITMKAKVGSVAEFFYKTSESNSFDQKKSKYYSIISEDMTAYTFETGDFDSWSGMLTGFRIDPCAEAGTTFTVKSVEFLSSSRTDLLSSTVHIGNKAMKLSYPARQAEPEVYCVFEPEYDLDKLLDCYYTWDRDNGVLTLDFSEHTYIFTVGKAAYSCDGEARMLEEPIEKIDGLPYIPIRQLCLDNGYAFSINDAKEICIEVPSEEGEPLDPSHSSGCFEFNTPGENEGWTCAYMNLSTDMGYMSCVSTVSFDDPNMFSKADLAIDTSKFNKLELRIRYHYDSVKNDWMQMFFVTDADSRWSESKAINIGYADTNSGDAFQTYTFDLSKLDTWKDTVTCLRFDPFSKTGQIDIDYIRFVYDETLEEKQD